MRTWRPLELLRLGRIEYAGFALYLMLFGALSLRGSNLQPTDMLLLLALAVFMNQASYAHNDTCDVELDRGSADLSERPLVSRAVSATSARRMVACCVLASLAITILFARGPWGIPVFLLIMGLGWAYNKVSKKLPGADVLLAGAYALQCLFGAALVAGRGQALAMNWRMVWVVVAIQFLDMMGANACHALKDVRNDRASSAVTMPVFLGVVVREDNTILMSRRFRATILLLKFLAMGVLFLSPFWTGAPFSSLQILLLGVGAAGSLYLTMDTLSIDVLEKGDIAWRTSKQITANASMAPLLLVQTAGWPCVLLLLAAAPGWYLLCNIVFYRRGLSLWRGF